MTETTSELGSKSLPAPMPPIPFAGNMMDRVDQLRVHPERLAAAWAEPRARLILLDGLDPVMDEDGALATASLAPEARIEDHALLGIDEAGVPHFVSLLARAVLAPAVPSTEPPPPQPVWLLASQLTPADLALYGCARSLVDWHRRHGFCANCGSPSVPIRAGWARRCGGCETEHYPRTDPVVIMLAEYRGKVLVGRGVRFPPGRFSALAGFVEPGETIEEAVRRELWEETGIRTGRVDYLMSQPWPFPSQLMIACFAQALGSELTLDTEEIAEAMWVDPAQVRAALDKDEQAAFQAPPRIAVAHHMLRHWLERTGG